MRPEFDSLAVHPEMARLRAATVAGDWTAITAFFAGVTDEEGRALGIDVITEVDGVEGLLHQVTASNPSLTLPRVLLASRYITLAWEARTDQRAQHVSREQYRVFFAHLRQAEQLLIDIVARDPSAVQAWALRITTAMGLQLGQSEARRRYDRLVKHGRPFLSAQSRLMQKLCPKWGGSWEAVHAFGQECMRSAEPGGLGGVMVVDGHVERWLDLGGGSEGAHYLSGPEVHQEIVEAAAWSVLHPAYRPGYKWLYAQSAFAMAFSLIGDYHRAAPHFQALGDRASKYPWAYLSDPAGEFVRHRTAALGRS